MYVHQLSNINQIFLYFKGIKYLAIQQNKKVWENSCVLKSNNKKRDVILSYVQTKYNNCVLKSNNCERNKTIDLQE
jgi:hypothetical protein